MWGLVGDGQGLGPQLLLNLQGLQMRAFLGQVSIHQIAHTRLQNIRQFGDKFVMRLNLFGLSAQIAQSLVYIGNGG